MALFQSFGQGEFWSSNYTINRYAQLTASTKMSTNLVGRDGAYALEHVMDARLSRLGSIR